MYKFFIFILAIGHFQFLQAQYSIEGKIRDIGLKEVEFVTVVLSKDSSLVSGTITDKNGHFKLSDLKNGKYDLKISLIGFETVTKKLNIKGNLKLDSIFICPREYKLDEVTVVGTKTQIRSEVNKTTFEVSGSIKSQSTDIFQILQHVPEITVDIVSRNIQINGMSNILILVNGVQRNMSYASGIPTGDIEKIELINNPSGKYISQDISSVINIITKNQTSGYNGYIGTTQSPSLSYGLTNGSFQLYFKKVSVYVDGQNFFFNESGHHSERKTTIIGDNLDMRYLKISNKYPFNYLSNSLNGGIDYYLSNKSLLIFNYNMSINSYDMSPEFLASYFENNIRQNNYNIEQYNENSTNNIIYSLYYQHDNSEKNKKLVLKADYNIFDSDYLNKYTELNTNQAMHYNQFFDNKKEVYNLYVDYEFSIGNIFDVEIGSRMNNQQITFLSKYNNINQNIFNYDELRNATYINVLNSLNDKFSYQVGCNFDASLIQINDSIHNNYMFLLPSIGVHYQLSKSSSFKINYGLYRENPTIAALNPFSRFDDSTKLITGNPYLSPYYLNTIKLNYAYTKGAIFISPSINYITTNEYITTSGKIDNNGIYKITYNKTANYSNLNSNINLSISVNKWCRVKSELKFDYKLFNDISIDKRIFSLGILMQTSFFYKNYYLQLSLSKDPDDLFANSRYIKPIETMAFFQWKISKYFSINSGVRYIMPWKEEFEINENGYFESYKKSIDERKYLVFIGFRYNLSKGFQGRENQKKIYQPESDAQMRERY